MIREVAIHTRATTEETAMKMHVNQMEPSAYVKITVQTVLTENIVNFVSNSKNNWNKFQNICFPLVWP